MGLSVGGGGVECGGVGWGGGITIGALLLISSVQTG